MGLRIGLLIGIALAIYKTMQSRRNDGVPAPEPWQPIVDTPRPRPPVDEVGEPVMEPPRADLRMPDVPPSAPPAPPAPAPVEADVAMVAAEIADPEPVAKPEPVSEPDGASPLDVVANKVESPVKKAAKTAKKAVKKAAKKVTTAKKSPTKAPVDAAPVADAGDALPAYVEPVGLVCPQTHQVKAKVASRLFHLPGMLAYDRTRPDRCYVDAATAEADGFTQAKR